MRTRPKALREAAALERALETRLLPVEAGYALGASQALKWAAGKLAVPPSEMFAFMRQSGRQARRKAGRR